jgi:very-short-patch-repair endonuclease
MRKVFLEDLPRKGKLINWKESVGYKIKFVYEDVEGELEIADYIYPNLYLNYEDVNRYKTTTSTFKQAQIGKLLKKITSNFRINIGTHFKDNKRDIIIIDNIYNNRKCYKYKCNICNNEDIRTEYELLKGYGCNVCCSPSKKVLKGYNDIATTHPYLIDFLYDKDDAYLFTYNSTKLVKVKCPFCNNIKEITMEKLYANSGVACACGDKISYPNKFMYKLLQQLNIDFQTEYSPNWIKPKRYDFYFDHKNNKYIIEMDGAFHTKDNDLSGQTKERSKEIDCYKDTQANKNNIKVIRINSEKSNMEFLKNNIYGSYLSSIFDLSQVDWLKCHEFSLSNMIKTICKMWNNEIEDYTRIEKETKLNKQTIRKYLKQGSKLGWCKYDSLEFSRKIQVANGKKNGSIIHKEGLKKVMCIENGIIFESSREVVELSNKIFGISMSRCSICEACNGKRNGKYKGYHWKYVD